ncbi:MAG: hypothetical protein AAFQ68_22865, partial [Bacteroidota bacterium]
AKEMHEKEKQQGPFKIRFRTGSRSIPKHISTDRPRIVHQSRKQYYKPQKTVFAEVALPKPKPKIEQPTEVKEIEEVESPASQNANPEIIAESQDEIVKTKTVETENLPIKEEERSTEGETKNIEKPIAKPITAAAVNFPKSQIAKRSSLPVYFEMPDNVRIQFIVKNTKGEVVKKGAGQLVAGRHEKFLEMKDLKPGRYQILLKAGEIRKKHVFEIR